MNNKALHKISYGVYVITSSNQDKINGQICNTVFQVTAEPPQVAVAINKQNYTHEFILASRAFAVNVLNQDTDMVFIGRFGFRCGRDIDKFEGIKFHLSQKGNPVLDEHNIAFVEVEVEQEVDVGTHTLFIGPVTDAEIFNAETPLTYDHYQTVKKGKAPKTATTYIKE